MFKTLSQTVVICFILTSSTFADIYSDFYYSKDAANESLSFLQDQLNSAHNAYNIQNNRKNDMVSRRQTILGYLFNNDPPTEAYCLEQMVLAQTKITLAEGNLLYANEGIINAEDYQGAANISKQTGDGHAYNSIFFEVGSPEHTSYILLATDDYDNIVVQCGHGMDELGIPNQFGSFADIIDAANRVEQAEEIIEEIEQLLGL